VVRRHDGGKHTRWGHTRDTFPQEAGLWTPRVRSNFPDRAVRISYPGVAARTHTRWGHTRDTFPQEAGLWTRRECNNFQDRAVRISYPAVAAPCKGGMVTGNSKTLHVLKILFLRTRVGNLRLGPRRGLHVPRASVCVCVCVCVRAPNRCLFGAQIPTHGTCLVLFSTPYPVLRQKPSGETKHAHRWLPLRAAWCRGHSRASLGRPRCSS
jgi:hypothetical protein